MKYARLLFLFIPIVFQFQNNEPNAQKQTLHFVIKLRSINSDFITCNKQNNLQNF